VQPVGGNHDLRLLDVAVRAQCPGTRRDVLVADDCPVGDEVDTGPLAGPQQDPVQVAAVDDHVGKAVPPLQVAQVEPGQLGGVKRVLHDHALGEHAEPPGLVQETVLVEDARTVRRDLHPRTDLSEL
jgi:hypothetical protein